MLASTNSIAPLNILNLYSNNATPTAEEQRENGRIVEELNKLSFKEGDIEITRLAAKGLREKDIAQELHITEKAVSSRKFKLQKEIREALQNTGAQIGTFTSTVMLMLASGKINLRDLIVEILQLQPQNKPIQQSPSTEKTKAECILDLFKPSENNAAIARELETVGQTQKPLEIARLIAEGKTNKDIARELGLELNKVCSLRTQLGALTPKEGILPSIVTLIAQGKINLKDVVKNILGIKTK